MLEAGFCEPLIILSGVKDSSKENWNYSPGVTIISSHLSGLVLTPLETEPRPRCTSLVYRGRVERVQKWKLSRHDWILHLQCSIFCDFSKSLLPLKPEFLWLWNGNNNKYLPGQVTEFKIHLWKVGALWMPVIFPLFTPILGWVFLRSSSLTEVILLLKVLWYFKSNDSLTVNLVLSI